MTEQARTPDELLAEFAELYKKKNEDYGNSWQEAGKLFATIRSQVRKRTVSVQMQIADQLLTRMQDKICRLIHMIGCSGVSICPPNFESVFDSARDLSVYAAMLASLFTSGKDDEK